MSTSGETDAQPDDEDPESDLHQEVQEAISTAESALSTARRSQQRVLELRGQLQDRDEEIDDLQEEIGRLERELREVRERTDLLEHVKKAASLKPETRAAICIQTLYNSAMKRKRDSTSDKARASMDYKGAENALGGAMNREPIYRTFDRAEKLVGDEDVCRKIKEDRSSDKNTRLVIDLTEGDLPQTIAGHEITEPDGGA
jgi:uncharacterized protein YigA (DUF484 family)